jgi:hypothetical protein
MSGAEPGTLTEEADAKERGHGLQATYRPVCPRGPVCVRFTTCFPKDTIGRLAVAFSTSPV